MSEELDVIDNDVAPEVDIDIAFAEGFSDEVSATAPTQAEVEQAVKDNPYFTEAQVRELLEQNNQRVFGKLGELNRNVQQLQSAPAPQYQPANVPVTAESFEAIREEFGEDFAQAIAKDLAKIPLALQQQGFDQRQIDVLVEQRTDALQKQFELKLLGIAHSDWRDIVNGNEFNEWKQKQTPEVMHALDNSWDSEFLSSKLSEFKQSMNKAKQITDARKSKLAAAAVPSSSGGSFDDSDLEDYFAQGFNS